MLVLLVVCISLASLFLDVAFIKFCNIFAVVHLHPFEFQVSLAVSRPTLSTI